MTALTMYQLAAQDLPKHVIETQCRCAGIFIVRRQDDGFQVLLVETRRKSFQFSFPKGKRNKNEPTLDAAIRELYEETGLTGQDYELYPEKWYVEYREDTRTPHIVYYVAKLTNPQAVLRPIDTHEVLAARWYSASDIYALQRARAFCYQRRRIVTRGLEEWARECGQQSTR